MVTVYLDDKFLTNNTNHIKMFMSYYISDPMRAFYEVNVLDIAQISQDEIFKHDVSSDQKFKVYDDIMKKDFFYNNVIFLLRGFDGVVGMHLKNEKVVLFDFGNTFKKFNKKCFEIMEYDEKKHKKILDEFYLSYMWTDEIKETDCRLIESPYYIIKKLEKKIKEYEKGEKKLGILDTFEYKADVQKLEFIHDYCHHFKNDTALMSSIRDISAKFVEIMLKAGEKTYIDKFLIFLPDDVKFPSDKEGIFVKKKNLLKEGYKSTLEKNTLEIKKKNVTIEKKIREKIEEREKKQREREEQEIQNEIEQKKKREEERKLEEIENERLKREKIKEENRKERKIQFEREEKKKEERRQGSQNNLSEMEREIVKAMEENYELYKELKKNNIDDREMKFFYELYNLLKKDYGKFKEYVIEREKGLKNELAKEKDAYDFFPENLKKKINNNGLIQGELFLFLIIKSKETWIKGLEDLADQPKAENGTSKIYDYDIRKYYNKYRHYLDDGEILKRMKKTIEKIMIIQDNNIDIDDINKIIYFIKEKEYLSQKYPYEYIPKFEEYEKKIDYIYKSIPEIDKGEDNEKNEDGKDKNANENKNDDENESNDNENVAKENVAKENVAKENDDNENNDNENNDNENNDKENNDNENNDKENNDKENNDKENNDKENNDNENVAKENVAKENDDNENVAKENYENYKNKKKSQEEKGTSTDYDYIIGSQFDGYLNEYSDEFKVKIMGIVNKIKRIQENKKYKNDTKLNSMIYMLNEELRYTSRARVKIGGRGKFMEKLGEIEQYVDKKLKELEEKDDEITISSKLKKKVKRITEEEIVLDNMIETPKNKKLKK